MPNETILLVVIAVLLLVVIVLLILLPRRRWISQYELTLDPTMREQVADIGKGIRHHAEVSAVLGLMDQLAEQPDAVERLRDYPETVRAAAWLHYINRLGSDLQKAQTELSTVHQTPDYRYSMLNTKSQAINAAQQHVDAIRRKLDAAIEASGQTVGPRAV